MKYCKVKVALTFIAIIGFYGCRKSTVTNQSNNNKEFTVELPQVNYPLPVVDNILNNCKSEKKRSLNENPVAYILRGINDIYKRTSDEYQKASSGDGPDKSDYIKANPIIDAVLWKENIDYVITITHTRSDDEAILAYLDDVRSKYYSVIDGFGPLTEEYVRNSGAYVDLPDILVHKVLKDVHYQTEFNNGMEYAGSEKSAFGAVVKLARDFQYTCSSTNAPKYLFSTPRPWRMDDNGAINFLGTTYDTILHKPTYCCIDHNGVKNYKIFDTYESSVTVVPGLTCSRKDHGVIYDDDKPSIDDLYSNVTENIRIDNGYPSGHTNAGMLISLAYAYAFPERFTELVFRGSQLGENRIISGMHSPVDVIGGKLMALSVACAALANPEITEEAETAIQVLFEYFGAKADSAKMNLYDYAHREIINPTGYTIGQNVNVEVFDNNIYDNKAEIKRIYRERLTYGFSQDKEKASQKPIVPKGAEAILKSRFPYLTDNQRRLVLYTTEIPSGYKILDKTNGWGRIDLVTASDGFGSFIGLVNVDMDSSLGRYNAFDTWGNNIDGNGHLNKSGSGKLVLTGDNSYTGGTSIEEGVLATTSYTALGLGDVFLKEQGTLDVSCPLNISGSYHQSGGTLLVHVSSDATALININGETSLNNSSLKVLFEENTHPHKGDKFAILQSNNISGDFNNVTAKGYQVVCEKIDNTIYLVVK